MICELIFFRVHMVLILSGLHQLCCFQDHWNYSNDWNYMKDMSSLCSWFCFRFWKFECKLMKIVNFCCRASINLLVLNHFILPIKRINHWENKVKYWIAWNGCIRVSQMKLNLRHISTLNFCHWLEMFQRRALEEIGISRRFVRIQLLMRDLPRRCSSNQVIAANFHDASCQEFCIP